MNKELMKNALKICAATPLLLWLILVELWGKWVWYGLLRRPRMTKPGMSCTVTVTRRLRSGR
jgi:hypothetical protein